MKKLLIVLVMLLLTGMGSAQDNREESRSLISDGMSAYSQGDYGTAITAFKQALELEPGRASVAYNISCCYALNKEPESALVWLEKVVDMGVYVFADDEDFASIRDLPRFNELEQIAADHIKEIKNKELLPVISLPDEYTLQRQFPVVIALHGFGSNPVDFNRSLQKAVCGNGYVLVCPYGADVRGTTSFGWGEDPAMIGGKLADIIGWIHNSLNTDPDHVVLLGYSQGGWIAYYCGLSRHELFKGVIAVAGYFPEQADSLLKLIKATDTKFYAMIGEKDHAYPTNICARESLEKKSIQFKLQSYPDLGHAFPPNADQEIEKALEWIETQ